MSSMILLRNTAPKDENTAFIYSGLGSISGEGRKYLKTIAQSLVAIQNRPGVPLPDSICKEIVQNQTDEVLQGV